MQRPRRGGGVAGQLVLTRSLIAFAVALPCAAEAACPGRTTVEQADCAQIEFNRAVQDLTTAWWPVKAYFDDLGAGDALFDAQTKWIAYRDASCKAESALFQGGSIQPIVHLTCMTRMTRQHITDLRAMMQN